MTTTAKIRGKKAKGSDRKGPPLLLDVTVEVRALAARNSSSHDATPKAVLD
jgi:hypothetical protein